MTRTAGRPRGVLVATAVAVAVALTVTGCAAGQISQTADQVAAIDGNNGHLGKLTVLNVELAQAPNDGGYAAGASVPLLFQISNDGIDGDTLTGISSPVAGSVTLPKAVSLPPQYLRSFAASANQVVLNKLTKAVPYGMSVPVTFSFQSAGQLTLNVPIQIPAVRSSDRPTVNIQPPELTPLWLTGEKGAPESDTDTNVAKTTAPVETTAQTSAPASG